MWEYNSGLQTESNQTISCHHRETNRAAVKVDAVLVGLAPIGGRFSYTCHMMTKRSWRHEALPRLRSVTMPCARPGPQVKQEARGERGRGARGAKADLEHCRLLRGVLLCCRCLVGASSSVTPAIAQNAAVKAAREVCCFHCQACLEPPSRADAVRRAHR